ncbi:ABC transporter [Klebsormidium nitens]|uniref:ABC transporter n=1 Tax=Klebsormidium nitens TaxID=105231 RepID=A0A1Y1I8B5_KLENI|nr:ABC transporter [Klebsormidium nitens]|eukprot:GAQ86773.1 ABC transporter [Klebsormidium nitens]
MSDGPAASSPEDTPKTPNVLKREATQANRHSTSPTAQTETPRLQLRNLSLTSSSQERILDDVSLEVPRGRIVGLIGPSGSGKSTLLRAMNRLWEPGKGTVLLDGNDITALDVVKLRRRVGALFQTAALFDGTVADNVRYGPRLRGERSTDNQVEDLLQKAGLEPGMASVPASQLSGGQAQRVSLARTLANQPECLLLDEPTSALDPGATRLVEETILRLRDETGMTVVMVSHDVEQIRRVADEVCLLVKGRIVERGTPEELFASQQTLSQQFLKGTLEAGHAA